MKSLTGMQLSSCVSIFIPTHRSGFNNNKIDNLTFKNAIGKARIELEKSGMIPNESHGFLQPAYELLEDDNFWSQLSDGLAVFISRDRFEYYELPISFNTFVYVGQSFYLRPLLPMFAGDGRFFLLALSQNKVRFFEGSRYSITPVKIRDVVPMNMEEALIFEDHEANLQGRTDQVKYGSTLYHGHGLNEEDKKVQIEKYFRSIDNGLMEFLYDENAPMLIAAVDYLVPIYREVTNYPNVMDFHLKGNPDDDSPLLLHEKSWTLMRPYFAERQQKAVELFEQAKSFSTGSTSIEDVVPAAINGRIDTLFVNKDQYNVWGFYDMAENKVALQSERKRYSSCMLDKAAVQTFLKGGTVYNVPADQMPDDSTPVNAIFRY